MPLYYLEAKVLQSSPGMRRSLMYKMNVMPEMGLSLIRQTIATFPVGEEWCLHENFLMHVC